MKLLEQKSEKMLRRLGKNSVEFIFVVQSISALNSHIQKMHY